MSGGFLFYFRKSIITSLDITVNLKGERYNDWKYRGTYKGRKRVKSGDSTHTGSCGYPTECRYRGGFGRGYGTGTLIETSQGH